METLIHVVHIIVDTKMSEPITNRVKNSVYNKLICDALPEPFHGLHVLNHFEYVITHRPSLPNRCLEELGGGLILENPWCSRNMVVSLAKIS